MPILINTDIEVIVLNIMLVYNFHGQTVAGVKFLCLGYNGINSFLFFNTTKINQFKAKESEKKTIFVVFR